MNEKERDEAFEVPASEKERGVHERSEGNEREKARDEALPKFRSAEALAIGTGRLDNNCDQRYTPAYFLEY